MTESSFQLIGVAWSQVSCNDYVSNHDSPIGAPLRTGIWGLAGGAFWSKKNPKIEKNRRKMHIDFGCVFGCFLDAKWKQNRSKMCPKSISECISFSEAFLDRFLMARWRKSDFADLCFDIAGVRRTAIFH